MTTPSRRGPLIDASLDPICLAPTASILDAMRVINDALRHGLPKALAIVVDTSGVLRGVVTDGDMRAALLAGRDLASPIGDVMTSSPVVLLESADPSTYLGEIRRQVQSSGRNRSIRYALLSDELGRPRALIDVDQLLFAEEGTTGTVAVIGLGFVGLTVAVALAEHGHHVLGWDVSDVVRDRLRRADAHIHEPGLEPLLAAQLKDGRFRVADGPGDLGECGVFLVCVNSPLAESGADLSQLETALRQIGPSLRPSDVVVLRSTVPVGTCRGLVKRVIEEESGLRVGIDIGIAFAPERTVAGNALEELRALPQVIAGINHRSAAVAEQLFAALSPMIIRVERLEEAELVKLVNNSFRDVSFAFANEIAMVCERHNLSVRSVINASNAGYPRNPVALPSPGVGGPCLSKDPYFLAAAAHGSDVPSLAATARAINERMPRRIAERIVESLQAMGRPPAEATVFVLGLAFKGEPETNDLRDSPSLQLIRALETHGTRVVGWDAVADADAAAAHGVEWRNLDEGFHGIDAVAVMNNHRHIAALDAYQVVEQMNRPGVLFDGFGFFDSAELRRLDGLRYLDLSYSSPVEGAAP